LMLNNETRSHSSAPWERARFIELNRLRLAPAVFLRPREWSSPQNNHVVTKNKIDQRFQTNLNEGPNSNRAHGALLQGVLLDAQQRNKIA
jgi:hypothetical protein